MTEYEWEQIQLLYGFKLAQDQQGATCPDSLTPKQLAIMQRPFLQTAPNRVDARRRQLEFLSRLKEAIDCDQLHSLSRIRLVPITEVRTVENRLAPRSAWQISGGWGSGSHERPPLVRKTVKTGEREEEYKVVERTAFREWLSARGEPPSEHIQAWFAARLAHDADTEEPHQDNAAAASEKPLAQPERPKVKRDYVMGVIDRVAAYCEERKIEFDRHSMPGKASDLLWVMGRLYPDQFEGMLLKTFQDHYKGVCSWPRSAAHQDGARSIYLEVFPEARTQVAGVVPIYK